MKTRPSAHPAASGADDGRGPAGGRPAAIDRWLRVPERHPGRTVLAIALLLTTFYSAALVYLPKRDGRIVVGDAVYYYVYLRSVVFDGDLRFQNDFVRIYQFKGGEPGTEWVYERTATDHTRNMMSIGPPIVWAPLFLLVTAGVWIAGLAGATYPFDGFGRLFQATAGYSGIAAAVIGTWLSYLLCRRFYSARTSIWATLAVWLGSNAVYYTAISPTYSHSASMLAVSAFFYVWAASLGQQTPWRYAKVGLLGGFVTLVRWQDAVFMIVPFVDACWQLASAAPAERRTSFRRAFVNLATCGAASLVAFVPQIWVWMVLYGQPVAMPQGAEWMQWTSPRFFLVLFSDWHGLFTWTPVLLLAVIGLVPLARRHPLIGVASIAAFLVSLYGNAAVIEWWAGEAFGLRRFVSCFPLFVLGFAALTDRLRLRSLVALAGVFIALNGLLLFQYQLFMHGSREVAPYPRGFYNLVLARFVVPFRFLAHLWGA